MYTENRHHLNEDGYLDSENRHLVIKDGINNNHAITKLQLHTLEQNTKNQIVQSINTLKSQIPNLVQNPITSAINTLKSQIQTQMNETIKSSLEEFQTKMIKIIIQFRNKQIEEVNNE